MYFLRKINVRSNYNINNIWNAADILHLKMLTILAPEILGNRNIKSRIRRFDWLLESLESSVVIGCFV